VEIVTFSSRGVKLSNPFHLSFVVPNLRLTEKFYVDFLGCKKGRDTGEWIDIIFFGHQLTLHQETENMKAKAIDHFGIILEKTEWISIAQKIKAKNIPFVVSPNEKINDDNSESGKFIIEDPASNKIEFKFYQKSPVDRLS
jgi:extradiol dioxygenase family protein